jgi:uncharacterized RDD family membrane protein YckC
VAQRTTSTPAASVADPPASLARRFGALLVDWIMCVFVSAFVADPRRNGWAAPLVLFAENTFFIGLFGQTPGMRLTRIRCVAQADGGPLGLPRAALRALLLCLLVPALVMRDQRGLHDRAAGSVVLSGHPPR